MKPWKYPLDATIFAAIVAAAAMAACYPSPETSLEELDTVITAVDEETDFSRFKTYVLPDTIIYRPKSGQVSEEVKSLILESIHRNMVDFGYALETDPENRSPDVVVIAGVVTRDEYGAWISWPFFGGFGPFNGWAVGYPPITVDYFFTVGTVTIDIIDYESIDSIAKEIDAVWTAAVNGVLQSDVDEQARRTKDGIDQAFAQSPYLKVK